MNLFGTIYSCNTVVPIMKQQRSGKIITVSSVAGSSPSADGGYAHYGGPKLPSPITRGIWRRISVPSVLPLPRRDSEWADHGNNHSGQSIQSNRDRAGLFALRRLGTVEDCAKVVEFLCDR
jgi:3-oxoacyl-[acyl-carrier protein] reductase